jgi:hypothetical protein
VFYEITEAFVKKTQGVPVWEYLGIRQDTWCKIKKTDKLSLDHYRSISYLVITDYHICDNQEELAKRMVEVYYA